MIEKKLNSPAPLISNISALAVFSRNALYKSTFYLLYLPLHPLWAPKRLAPPSRPPRLQTATYSSIRFPR